MKRFVPLCLLLLLLCGCAKENTPPTTEATIAPTETLPADTYISGSDIEAISEGALKQYDLGKAPSWIVPFDGGVLAVTVENDTVLTILSGENGAVKATTELPANLKKTDLQVISGGVVYYDSGVKQVVFLDSDLRETKRLQLPMDISGEPAVPATGSQVYYCVDQTVYAMDAAQKTIRPVRTNTCNEQTLLGCYLDGTVVACRILDTADKWHTLYISGEDGRLLHKDNSVQKIYTHGDTYFALRTDGIVNQYIYGKSTDSGLPVQMNIDDDNAFGALEHGGIIGQTKTDNGYRLSFYNMKKTAAVTLPPEWEVICVAAEDNGIWLLTANGKILRWNLEKSAVTEDIDYSGTIYTAAAPDTDGLKDCAARGDAIGKKYGVVLRVWERALVSNDDYNIEVEYQPVAINKTLDELEAVLALFPEKFLDKSVSGGIRICIVRSVDGQQKSVYHWTDGDPFIVISAGMDVKQAFLDAFAYIVDIHILGNSPDVDTWTSLNPAGFKYGTETTVMAYLEGETRAFTDRKGMQSITDDRTSIFIQALAQGNEEMFKAEIMQKKLVMLCKAIRNAWKLEKNEEAFLWEQYLKEPIAY